LFTTIFVGQLIEGGCVSFTVIVKLQDAVLPEGSDAVHVTIVVPIGKNEPDAGEQTTEETISLSVAVGAG
jgi:hypothetical protein